jgi:DNA-directed RNA polymerase subunit alpha
MDQAAHEGLEAIVAKEAWTPQDHSQLLACLFNENEGPRKFQAIVAQMESQNAEPRGSTALKIGIARYMLCRFGEALASLSAAGDSKDRYWFEAQCHKGLRRWEDAQAAFESARQKGWDADAVDLQLCEVRALGGKLDAAAAMLAKLESRCGGKADFLYVRGLIDELSGRGEQAVKAYQHARQLDPCHAGATFRLAYYCDLHGDEESAMDFYRQCLSRPPVHANALMNMAVLHEDAGRYEQAVGCLRRVLATNPGHLRARLFLRDAEASRTMFYDEDQAKRNAKRNAVLDIPVTDFELSVRARNCLKKMNVRTLGDLVRTSEAELLSYKNFGETSLKEIKEMLSAKNLRLGMSDDEGDKFDAVLAPPKPSQDGVLATPLPQIEFSVRARKALDTLGLRTLGDLAAKSEPELLACRNFGQTSLNEVVQRLAEYGLRLRESV